MTETYERKLNQLLEMIPVWPGLPFRYLYLVNYYVILKPHVRRFYVCFENLNRDLGAFYF